MTKVSARNKCNIHELPLSHTAFTPDGTGLQQQNHAPIMTPAPQLDLSNTNVAVERDSARVGIQ